MKRVKLFWKVLRNAGNGFVDDNAFKLSASLSYYTIFALAPLLIIIISLAGLFFKKEDVQGRIYQQLNSVIGNDAAYQIQQIILNIQQSETGTVATIIAGIVLFIGATGVFTELQDSINFIWSVKAKPKRGWLKFIGNRLLSFSLIVSMGFLLLVSLVISALLDLLSGKLIKLFPNYSVYLFHALNVLLIILVIGTLFAIIFKVLPDAVISWKDAMVGAIFTALLFLLGKFLISYYISKSTLDVTYGTAASIVILLSWVYYSALILYFGAEFTKMYALQAGSGIRPKETAVFIIKKEAKEIPESYLQ